MSQKVIKFFIYLACCFFAISLVLHFLTYLPSLRTSRYFLFIPTVVGIFPSFVVAILAIKINMPKRASGDVMKTALRGAPKILKRLMIIVAVYVVFNFFFSLMVLNKGGLVPRIVGNEYVLEYKGKVKEKISEVQYYEHKAYLFRAVTGHTFLFYMMSIALLSSAFNIRKQNEELLNVGE